jgi:hypothetical protein
LRRSPAAPSTTARWRPAAVARAQPRPPRRDRVHAVCLELSPLRYRRRFFRIGARAAALCDRLCLAVAGAGREAVCGARPCRGLQGHVHGWRRTRGSEGREGRCRRDHCARHRGRRACRLANDRDARSYGGRRRRAHPSARRRRNCRRARIGGGNNASAPTGCCLEPDSWPAANRRYMPISSRPFWRATDTTRFSPKYRISRLGWSGPGRCHARGATASSSDGRDGNGHCVNAERKQRRHCKRRARVATSRKPFCRWGKMPGSFTISCPPPRSSVGSPKMPNAY